MKQIRAILAAISMCILLSVPMMAFASAESEPDTWVESMESRNVVADAGEEESAVYERETEAGQEAEAIQKTGVEQESEAAQETVADQETKAGQETEAEQGTETKQETEAIQGTEVEQEAEAIQKTGREQEAEAKQETEADQETRAKQEVVTSQADKGDFGILWIQNAAAGCGERLSGAVFAVYEKNGTKIEELTLMEGAVSLSLPLGDYYLKQLKAPTGYGLESAWITFAITKGETTLVEVTSEIDLTNVNPQDVIPKTGQAPPIRAYALSVLCFMIALFCSVKLWRIDGRNRRKGGAYLWQS